MALGAPTLALAQGVHDHLYRSHLKDPAQLLRESGVQTLHGSANDLSSPPSHQFLFAPVLWSFWITIFGYHHPIQNVLGDSTIQALLLLFFFSEILTMTMGMTAVTSPNRRHLLKRVVTMPLHFTLGPLASYKALYELIVTPFYWDKTEHGAVKPDVVDRLPTQQLPFFLASCRVLL